MLDLPIEELCTFLVDRGDLARELRQVAPFAGVVDPRARWRIWRDVAQSGRMAARPEAGVQRVA